MTSISKNVHIDKLDDIVNEYNNTYHKRITIEPVDIKSGNYVEYNVNSNDKDSNFQVGDHVRTSITKKKNLAKEYTPNQSEQCFVFKKVKSTAPWTYVINDLNGEDVFGTFYEKKSCKKQIRIQDRKSNQEKRK